MKLKNQRRWTEFSGESGQIVRRLHCVGMEMELTGLVEEQLETGVCGGRCSSPKDRQREEGSWSK